MTSFRNMAASAALAATVALTPVQAMAISHTSIQPTLTRVMNVMEQNGLRNDADLIEIEGMMSVCIQQTENNEAHKQLARMIRSKLAALIVRLQQAGIKGLDSQVTELMAATEPELG